MKMHIHLFTFIFTLLIIYYKSDGQLLNCPRNQIQFEKLIGIKPDYLQKNTLLYRSNNNTPVTLNCLTKCESDVKCASFLLYYNTSECYSYTTSSNVTTIYDYDTRPDTNVIWFRKTCLNVPANCSNKAWAIEILAGATLIGYNTRRINGNISRQRCIENCFAERNFQCKSIKFSVRSNAIALMEADPTGTCTLSDTDRHLTTTGFRVSRYEDEYIENQCVNTSFSSEYCAYEEYDNTTLEHVDLTFTNFTQEDCKNMCDMSQAFNCRGYSIIPLPSRQLQVSNTSRYNCLLHSEDSKLIGPKLLVGHQGATYYERARCLNVSVICSSSTMMVRYKPEQTFTGRIYTSGYSDVRPCYADGQYNDTIILTIPLNGSICGLSQANSIGSYNRTLQSVLLVIQYNSLIQTQADRLIKVGCLLGNGNGGDDPEITLGTSVNFTNGYPNHGSTIVNSSSVLPTVTMRVVDYNTKQPVRNTELGEELQMIIEITPGDGPYDIWAGNLVATSDNNNDTIKLLDENGCPAYYNLIAPFTNIQTNTSRMLVTNFQAFKFPSTPVLRFSIMVHFCTLTCPPRQCPPENTRTKRESPSTERIVNDSLMATVYKIRNRKNKNETEFDIDDAMPLEFMLIVKGVNIAPDQLVLGENRLLVAGLDYAHNEVCVDYSLFIGLFVIWVLLQVIIVVCCWLLIRKYKKYFHIAYTRQLDDMHQNFGYGDTNLNRRVRWADQ